MAARRREQPAVSGLETHLGYWLRRISNRISAAFALGLQTMQVSVAEWVVLRQIYGQSEAQPAELADVLGLTRGAVSKILDKLERRGWISRQTSTRDKRAQLLSVTAQGRRILPRLAAIADANDARFFDCLTEEERATLRYLLQKLAECHQIRDVPVE